MSITHIQNMNYQHTDELSEFDLSGIVGSGDLGSGDFTSLIVLGSKKGKGGFTTLQAAINNEIATLKSEGKTQTETLATLFTDFRQLAETTSEIPTLAQATAAWLSGGGSAGINGPNGGSSGMAASPYYAVLQVAAAYS